MVLLDRSEVCTILLDVYISFTRTIHFQLKFFQSVIHLGVL
jgi:hypothetical protein